MKTFNYQTISHKSSLGFLFFNCTYSFRFWRQCNLNSFERWINVNNIQKTPLKLFQSFSFSPNPWSAIVCVFQTNSMDCQWLAVPCSSIIELRNFVSRGVITKWKWFNSTKKYSFSHWYRFRNLQAGKKCNMYLSRFVTKAKSIYLVLRESSQGHSKLVFPLADLLQNTRYLKLNPEHHKEWQEKHSGTSHFLGQTLNM